MKRRYPAWSAAIPLIVACLSQPVAAASDIEPPPELAAMSAAERASIMNIFNDRLARGEPLAPGASENKLIQRLGQPDGVIGVGNRKRLTYDEGWVIVKDGVVVSLDNIPEDRLRSPSAEAYAEFQSACGKVRYMGRWMTPGESKAAYEKAVSAQNRSEEWVSRKKAEVDARQKSIVRSQALRSGQVAVIRRKGVEISEQELVNPGKITVVDFFADWCGPCKALNPYLVRLSQDPEIKVVKVDIVNWNTPVVAQWNLTSIPNLRVYDKNGRLRGEPSSSLRPILQQISDIKSGNITDFPDDVSGILKGPGNQ